MATERFSREQIQKQAETLKAYWERRGYKVNVNVVPITEVDQSALPGKEVNISGWKMETDMRAGLPKELFDKRVNAEKAG